MTSHGDNTDHPFASSWVGLLGPFLSRRPFARVCRLSFCPCTTVLQVCFRLDQRREFSLHNQPSWATFWRDGGVLGVHRRGVVANCTQAQGRAHEAEPAYRRAQEEGSASRSAHRECRKIVEPPRGSVNFLPCFSSVLKHGGLHAAHTLCTHLQAPSPRRGWHGSFA